MEYIKNYPCLTTKEKPNSYISISIYSNSQHGKLLDTYLPSEKAADQQHEVNTITSPNELTDMDEDTINAAVKRSLSVSSSSTMNDFPLTREPLETKQKNKKIRVIIVFRRAQPDNKFNRFLSGCVLYISAQSNENVKTFGEFGSASFVACIKCL